ncbi:MAG TPA: ATP-binding cassette domain-containing protein [Bacillota bacterium]|nr:ATP-binding cassette domain-containing protein [Bacillota bacterium]
MALLEVKSLFKCFGKTQVLKDVSFDVERGEAISIIGSSGGGKTTLLRCLNLLELPDSGTINVGGDVIFDAAEREINQAQLRMRRLHFGLVFQQFNLFPQYSVLDNICLAPRLLAKENGGQTDAQINENAGTLLERVGLSDKRNNYPCELSGGQQQRVAIARALALKPDILCFDEPTSALDPELTGEVLRVIRSLKSADMTMIIVTHEMEFAKNVSDRVIFIADGEIEETGTPQQVFGSPQSAKTQAFLRNEKSGGIQ